MSGQAPVPEWARHLARARELLAEGERGLALVELEAALEKAPGGEQAGLHVMRSETRAALASARLDDVRALLDLSSGSRSETEADRDRSAAESMLQTAEALADTPELQAEARRLRDGMAGRAADESEGERHRGEGEVEIACLVSPHEAEMLRGLLENEGIGVRLVGQMPPGLFPLTVDGLAEIRVLVADGDAAAARDLLADFASGAESVPEGTPADAIGGDEPEGDEPARS